jgi:glyoxylate reductase
MCGQDIHRKTLGVVGIGRIGRAVARRGNGFDMRVLYHDEYRLPPEREQQLNIAYRPFEELLAEADFVSLHVPLLPATRHLIGAEQLSMMKKTAILINTSRGPVVDEAALADALEQGVIAAAGLDVYEREPAVQPRLLQLENAVLTPHIASASIATRTKMCLMAAENMIIALEGKRPPHLVNTELFDFQVG